MQAADPVSAALLDSRARCCYRLDPGLWRAPSGSGKWRGQRGALRMLRRTYDWLIGQAQAPYALWLLAGVSFVESSVFPIPPDVLLIPMVIAAPHRAWLIAGVCTLASVLGGLAGYAIGFWFFEAVGEPVLAFYGYDEKFGTFSDTYNEWGAWAVLIAGVTPFPYKVITILSGVTALDLWVFTVASMVARAARFFLVAALLWKFGPPIRDFIEARLGLVFTLGVALLLGGFVVAKVLVQ